ncbi:hypothetical protein OG194_29680 [Streptomyces sp. NBC_01288]|uniref:hypothetical protein n=1 Tax=Streptomyces sp. NBC_01288 TaxID=2903814 RepID=UPI002E1342F8|nr:hypothetical protein OG194_29680 [Streptomyces sp. NBC_01288]
MRIEIDLNSRNEEGLVPAYLEDADGYVTIGDTVTAFESEDGVAAPAVVRKVAHGFAYLDVDWDAMTDDVAQPVAHAVTPGAENLSATSSGASWVRVTMIRKVVTPILVSAAAVAAATTGAVLGSPGATPNSTAAPNSVSTRDVITVMEAGDTA